jgi:hypothetical protein
MERKTLQENMWRLARALRQIERALKKKAWQEAEEAAGQGQSYFGGCDEEIENAQEVALEAARGVVRLLAEGVHLPLTIDRQELSDACMSVRHNDARDVVSLIKVIDRAALVLANPERASAALEQTGSRSRGPGRNMQADMVPRAFEDPCLPDLRWAEDYSVVVLGRESWSFRGLQAYAIEFIIERSLGLRGPYDVPTSAVLERVEDREPRDEEETQHPRLRDLLKSSGAYGKGKLLIPGSRAGMIRLNIALPARKRRGS